MGLNVLEQSRVAGVRKLVLVGTICSYPKLAPTPFREDDLWKGYPEETNAPYGVAKKSLLVGAQAYREQYGLNAIFLLPTNLFGPRDNFDLETSHVIPALIRKMSESPEEVVLWGDGSPTREDLYVDDAVARIDRRAALAALVGLQWLVIVALALRIRHNGFLFHNGGDGTYYWTTTWALAHRILPETVFSYGLPVLLWPLGLVFGTSML